MVFCTLLELFVYGTLSEDLHCKKLKFVRQKLWSHDWRPNVYMPSNTHYCHIQSSGGGLFLHATCSINLVESGLVFSLTCKEQVPLNHLQLSHDSHIIKCLIFIRKITVSRLLMVE